MSDSVMGDGAVGNSAMNGLFITFEGGEGAGKSTQIRLLADALEAQGREVLCLREPGGTEIGEQLRGIVLDPANDCMADQAELLIYEAARAQIVAQVIAPALERGAVVLCDRFMDSTVAYQAYGRGLDRGFVDQANEFACQGVWPDRTLLLTCGDAARGLRRAAQVAEADRLEQAGSEFHARVNQAFLDIAAADPARVRVVDSSVSIEEVWDAIRVELADILPEL